MVAIKNTKEVSTHIIIDIESILKKNFIPSDCTQSKPQKLILDTYGFVGSNNISIRSTYVKWIAQTLLENLRIKISFDVNRGDIKISDITSGTNNKNGIDNSIFIY